MSTMAEAAEAKAEPDARSIEADARTVVARAVGVAWLVIVVAVVGAIAPEATIVRTETVMPDARPAMHLVGRVNISDGAQNGRRAGNHKRAGGRSKRPPGRQHGGARQVA